MSEVPEQKERVELSAAHLLRWLLHYTLQRVEDIALGCSLPEHTVRRHLHRLEIQALVEHIVYAPTSTSRQHWYHLTQAGLERAAALEGVAATTAARQWQTSERALLQLFPRLPMLLTIQNVLHRLVREAPSALAVSGAPSAIRWRWQRDVRLSWTNARQQTDTCHADGLGVLRRTLPSIHETAAHHDWYVLWIYVDLAGAGGWSRQRITTQLRALYRYRESQERQPFHTQFPLLVVLTNSELQREHWHQAVYDAALSLHLGTLLKGVLLDSADGVGTSPAQPAPLWHAPCQIAGTRQMSTLTELLQPLTRAALPPGLLVACPPLLREGQFPLTSRSRRQIRGGFQQRRAQMKQRKFELTQALSRDQERERVALLGLDISERARGLLLLLWAHPLLSAAELALLLTLAASSVLRYLWELARLSCVEAIHHSRRGHSDLRWKLTEHGLRYLAAAHHLPLSTLLGHSADGTRWQPGVMQMQQQLRHTAGVYTLLTAFYHAVASRPQEHIRWCESHQQAARRYKVQGTWHNLRPDATLLYEQQRALGAVQRWLFWLEWDGATMTREQLGEKLRSYAAYMCSREWRRFGSETGTPILLFVTPERGHADLLRDLAQEILARSQLQVFVALRDLFEAQGVFAPIWYQAVPVLPVEQRSVLRRMVPML